MNARRGLPCAVNHLRVQEAVGVALCRVPFLSAGWPPDANVVESSLEVAELGALALGGGASHIDGAEARLKHEVLFQVERLEGVACADVPAVEEEERLRDDNGGV